jgi:hypothetical protein
MKKIFITFVLLIASLAGFSQSFSVDPRSMSVPRYANQAAITAAIPTATTGMLVYNNALNQYAYFNGTAWTNFPAASTANLWTLNTTLNRVVAPSGTGIEADRITSQASSTLANPFINVIGNGTVFLNWGSATHNGKITQESVTGATLASSSINWNYYPNANPTQLNSLFGYSGSTGTFTHNSDLDINGFTTLGNTASSVALGVTKVTPAIQTLLLTGNIAAASSQTTIIAHGLTWNKIVDIKVLVSGLSNLTVAENFTDLRTTGGVTGYQFSTFTDPTNVYITRSSTNSANITPASGLVPTYRILITYTP